MQEYQESYIILWRGVSEAIEEINKQNFGRAREILLQSQIKAEERFIVWYEAD